MSHAWQETATFETSYTELWLQCCVIEVVNGNLLCHVETAADEAITNTAGGSGDEVVSASVSASVLNTADSTALIADNHADNRMSEMIVEDADEKCT